MSREIKYEDIIHNIKAFNMVDIIDTDNKVIEVFNKEGKIEKFNIPGIYQGVINFEENIKDYEEKTGREIPEYLKDSYFPILTKACVYLDVPATSEELKNLEKKLAETGKKITPILEDVLINFTKTIEYIYEVNEKVEEEVRKENIELTNSTGFYGDINIENFDDSEMVTWYTSDEKSDDYDPIWPNKLVVNDNCSGDYIAIDLSDENYEQVVYLEHASLEEEMGHGVVLADNFKEYLFKISQLGMIGNDFYCFEPFMKDGKFDPDCENARIFRKHLGVREEDIIK